MLERRMRIFLLISFILHMTIIFSLGSVPIFEVKKTPEWMKREQRKTIIEIRRLKKRETRVNLPKVPTFSPRPLKPKMVVMQNPLPKPLLTRFQMPEPNIGSNRRHFLEPPGSPKPIGEPGRPLKFGGGGGIESDRFRLQPRYIPPTSTGVKHSAPGPSLGKFEPGLNLKVPAGSPVSRGYGPGVGPGNIRGIGGGMRGIPEPLGGGGVGEPGRFVERVGEIGGRLRGKVAIAMSNLPGAAVTRKGEEITGQLNISQVILPGTDWNYRPNALEALADFVSNNTKLKCKVTPPIRFSSSEILDAPVVYATGRRSPFSLSEEEKRGFERYIDKGGFVWFDDGNPNYKRDSFERSVRNLISDVFGERAAWKRVGIDHPIFKHPFLMNRFPSGLDFVVTVVVPTDRPGYALEQRPREYVEIVEVDGRPAILFTRQDYGDMWNCHFVRSPQRMSLVSMQIRRAFEFSTNILFYILKISPMTR
jgi:hypothetical protein